MSYPTLAPTPGATLPPCARDEAFFIGDLATAATDCATTCPSGTYSARGEAGSCLTCPIVGCAICSADFCQECLMLHTLVDEQCLYVAGAVAGALALLAAGIAVCALLRRCCGAALAARDEDRDVLKEALAHRRRARLHDYTVDGSPLYKYDETRERVHNIAGVGVMLYFRFVVIVIVLCVLTSLSLLTKMLLPQMLEGGSSAETAAVAHAVVTYAACLLAVLSWARAQDMVTRTVFEEDPHLQNYALLAEGFPKSARSAHEVKAYIESVLGVDMEGVSIAFDHSLEVDFVRDRISRAVEKADVHLGVYSSALAEPEHTVDDNQDAFIIDSLPCSGWAFLVFSSERDRDACQRRFDEVGRRFRGATGGAASDEEDEGNAPNKRPGAMARSVGSTEDGDDDGDEDQALLRKVSSARANRKRAKADRAALFRSKYPIKVQPAPEPCGIQWHNFVARRNAKPNVLAMAFLGLLIVILASSASAFAPAVMYEMSYANIKDHSEGQLRFALLEQGIVSVCIAAGNRFCIFALRRSAEASGFLQEVAGDAAIVICSFVLLLANTLAPVIAASVYVAAESSWVPPHLAVQWLFQMFWMNLLVAEVGHCAAPSWRFWSGQFWLLENVSDFTVREAEPLMVGAKFPFATRYIDFLHSLSIVFIMAVCDPTSMYALGAQFMMLLYAPYAYLVDKYMLLRLCQSTYQRSHLLDVVARVFLAVPLSALLAWLLRELGVALGPWLQATAIAGHGLLLGMLLGLMARCGAARRDPEQTGADIVPYVEAATAVPYNYFNTNSVHVLRCMHFPSILVPPIFPYVPGKEYLQGGQFTDNDGAVHLRETLFLLARAPLLHAGVEPLGYLGVPGNGL